MSAPAPFETTLIEGMRTSCKGYRGQAAAITTFNGTPIVLLARTRSELVDVIKEISPHTNIKPSLFQPAVIISSSAVKDNDL